MHDTAQSVVLLVLVAVMDVVGIGMQRTGATHAPAAVSVLTAAAGVLVLVGAYGLARTTSYGWPVAVGATILTGCIAVGAMTQSIPAEKKALAVVGAVAVLAALAVVVPQRGAGVRAHV